MNRKQFDKKYHWLESKMVRPMEWQNDLMSMIASEREKAIAEHEAAKWLPYPKNKPEEPGKYLIQIGINRIMIDTWYYHGGNPDWITFPVIAFRELPAPYKEGGERCI